ncbi:hypothetical protein [Streptomyces sp. NPDC005799]|uniref:hypothetical protein n=1 Tax=Streptomyces sp. NPDC005799 TaxID=3154678 RepID=UPI0033F9634D
MSAHPRTACQMLADYGLSEGVIRGVLDIHAHELAEQIRAAYSGDGPDGDNWITNPYDAADLIDPKVSAGPRPDEEPT